MLRNVSKQDISVTVLGHKLSMPICVSPTAYQAMAHPDGELATVRGKLAVVTLTCDLQVHVILPSSPSNKIFKRKCPNQFTGERAF